MTHEGTTPDEQLTGRELIDVYRAHKDALSVPEIDELRARLSDERNRRVMQNKGLDEANRARVTEDDEQCDHCGEATNTFLSECQSCGADR
jgi:hypothetical protein